MAEQEEQRLLLILAKVLWMGDIDKEVRYSTEAREAAWRNVRSAEVPKAQRLQRKLALRGLTLSAIT